MNDAPVPHNEIASTLRILDANRNRAVEAARVIEEFCRFHLESEMLAKSCKEIRHAISATVSDMFANLPCPPLPFRETDRDVGTKIQSGDESARGSLDALVAVNFSRLQESLRCLEEYGKVVSPESGARFESIRYESYQLQKSLFHVDRAKHHLAQCQICVLTDATGSAAEFEQRIRMLVGAGVDMIQLREKNLNSDELLGRAKLLRDLTSEVETICIVNDRPDICALSEADGVHLGQTDMTVKDARKIVGDRLIGVSTHSLGQAEQAVRDGADYIGIGPMFASTTKQFDELKGCQLLHEITSCIPLPGFAIGGIDANNVQQVVQSGGTRVAISAAIWNASNPVECIDKIRIAVSDVIDD